MKKKLIIIMISGIFVFNLSGCKNSDTQSGSSNKPEILQEETNSGKEDDSSYSGESASEKLINTKEESTWIGLEKYGFIKVPDTWVSFIDSDVSPDSGIIQYCDSTENKSIITMKVFDNNISDVEAYAQTTAQSLIDEGVKAEGAKVKLGNYDAYQVYGYYKDEDIMLVTWHFLDENKKLHYISAEAPMANILNITGYIDNTYTLNK